MTSFEESKTVDLFQLVRKFMEELPLDIEKVEIERKVNENAATITLRVQTPDSDVAAPSPAKPLCASALTSINVQKNTPLGKVFCLATPKVLRQLRVWPKCGSSLITEPDAWPKMLKPSPLKTLVVSLTKDLVSHARTETQEEKEEFFELFKKMREKVREMKKEEQ